MDGVKLVKIEVPSWRASETEYDVVLDGVRLGRVRLRIEESWRKHNRIRTSMRGYSRTWEARATDGREITRYARTRRDAVAALVQAGA